MASSPNRPNILWISTDQQRADTLGCYGNPLVSTPNLDRLARAGTVFDGAYAQSPVCTPSRASFLTGRYPRTTRCRQNGQDVPEDEVLVTRLLADAGYACGLAGKLHVSACHPDLGRDGERRVRDGYADFHWSQTSSPTDPTGGEYRQWLADRRLSHARQPHPESAHIQTGSPEDRNQTTWCVEMALEFIRRRAGGPWLFCVNPFDPHHSFRGPQAYLDRYMAILDEIPLPHYVPGELDAKPPCQRIDHGGAHGRTCGFAWDGMTERDHRLVRASYWAMCDLIDHQIGRLLDALEQTGQLDNTLIVFMSDHGEMLGDHGIYLKGPYFYDPLVRVPLIVSWPGHVVARRSAALVELVDLAPTLLDAAGLDAHPGMQGRSLWPMLAGTAPAARHRDDVYCEYYNAMPFHRDPTAQATMVRTAGAKIVVDHAYNTGELYDLAGDPREHVNRWNDPAMLGLKTDMLLRLTHRMAGTADPLPERLAPW